MEILVNNKAVIYDLSLILKHIIYYYCLNMYLHARKYFRSFLLLASQLNKKLEFLDTFTLIL